MSDRSRVLLWAVIRVDSQGSVPDSWRSDETLLERYLKRLRSGAMKTPGL